MDNVKMKLAVVATLTSIVTLSSVLKTSADQQNVAGKDGNTFMEEDVPAQHGGEPIATPIRVPKAGQEITGHNGGLFMQEVTPARSGPRRPRPVMMNITTHLRSIGAPSNPSGASGEQPGLIPQNGTYSLVPLSSTNGKVIRVLQAPRFHEFPAAPTTGNDLPDALMGVPGFSRRVTTPATAAVPSPASAATSTSAPVTGKPVTPNAAPVAPNSSSSSRAPGAPY